MPELDASELLEKLASHCRQANYPAPLVDAIHSYLAGAGSLAEVEQQWQTFNSPQQQIVVPSLCSLSLSEGGQLHEFDRRRLDITLATGNSESMLDGLTLQAPFDDLYRYLSEQAAAQQQALNYLLASYDWMRDEQPTPLGHLLLRFLPEHFQAMLPLMPQLSWDAEYAEFLSLLLWAQPPFVDLVWQTLQQVPQGNLGDCADPLMKADPERFREWTRKIASSNGPGDEDDQATALQALFEHDIANHLEVAEAAAVGQRTFTSKWRTRQVRQAALEALWRFDSVKYLALVEEAVLGNEWHLADSAMDLFEAADFEMVRPSLERCAAKALPQMAYRAAKRLLENEWAGREDYALGLLSHRSKQVRDLAVEWLASQGAALLDRVIPLLKSASAATRLAAVQILTKAGGEHTQALLAEQFKREKAVTVKQAIVDAIGLPELPGDVPLASQIASISAAASKASKTTLRWLNREETFGLRWVTGEAVPFPVVRYLLICQARMKQAQLEMNARHILALLDAQTTGAGGMALFTSWLKRGTNAKESWLLPLCGALAGDQLIQPMRREIERWGKKTRGALAAKAVQAMAMIGSDLALTEVSDLAQNSKVGRVKTAARETMAAVAARLGVSREELDDRIAPRLGFDERGERRLDYGPRQFTVRLGFDLKLSVFDDAGKRLTTPPRGGKRDEPVKYRAALETWQLLKKSLPNAIARQTERLEHALATQRAWTLERWRQLFHQHPLLRTFSTRLVWGVVAVDGSSYTLLFRPLEDGSFTDADDEQVSLPDEGQIRLVHPVELGEETLAAWLQHLSDYEITPPFPQLSRPMLTLADEQRDACNWEAYKGYMVPGKAFVERYRRAGWEPADEERGEGYNLIWKAFSAASVEALLEIGCLPVGYEGGWPTPLIRLCFARAGAVARIKQASENDSDSETDNDDDAFDPYTHPHRIIEQDLLKLGEIPPVVFSEAAANVQSFAALGSYDEHWQKRLTEEVDEDDIPF
ncbi:MAG TPA: DUF4132 domain-containing protein [Ktedonobacterales bacterium]|jgi:hypothetical protein